MSRCQHLPGLLAALAIGGCAAPGAARVLEAPPAGPEEAAGFQDLLFSPRLSAHRVVVAEPLAAHVHRRHEETVYVISGRARMGVGDRWHELGPGSVVHVPAGVVHAVEPRGVVTALAIFSPPFDGRDRVFVEPAPATAPR